MWALDRLQINLPYWIVIGLGAICVASILFSIYLWCDLWWQEIRAKGRWKLDPSQLIMVGIIGASVFGVIAVGGVVWQWLAPSAIEIPKIEAQNESPKRKYTGYQLGKIQKAWDDISEALKALSVATNIAVNLSPPAFTVEIRSSGVEPVIAKIRDFDRKYKTASYTLWRAVSIYGALGGVNEVFQADRNNVPVPFLQTALLISELERLNKVSNDSGADINELVKNNSVYAEWYWRYIRQIRAWLDEKEKITAQKVDEFTNAEVYEETRPPKLQ